MKELTYQQVIELYAGLKNVTSLSGAKFSYAVLKNLKKLEKFIKDLDEANQVSDKFLEFDEKRMALIDKYGVKENGVLQTHKVEKDGKSYEEYTLTDEKAFKADFKVLERQYLDVIEQRKQQLKQFNLMLSQKIEFEPHMIKPIDLPDQITAKQIDSILSIIEEQN